MELYSRTNKQPYKFVLRGRDFNFIIENNFTPKAVLEKLLLCGVRMTFALSQCGNTVHCKIGKNLVAFAGRRRFEWLATQLDMGRQIHGVITVASGKLPERVIFVSVSYISDELPLIQKSPDKSKAVFTESKLKAKSALSLATYRKPKHIPKHPITEIGFYPHQNFESSCQKQNGKAGIYFIYNKDFKTYVGQSVNIGARWRKHVQELNLGTHHNPLLQADWSTLGASGFVFKVMEYNSPEQLDSREKHYIQQLKFLGCVYNATDDGQGKLPEKQPEGLSESEPFKCSGDDSFQQAVQNIVDEDLPYKSVVELRSSTSVPHNDTHYSEVDYVVSDTQTVAEKHYWEMKNKVEPLSIAKPNHPRVSKNVLKLLKIGSWFSYSCYRKFRFLSSRIKRQNLTHDVRKNLN